MIENYRKRKYGISEKYSFFFLKSNNRLLGERDERQMVAIMLTYITAKKIDLHLEHDYKCSPFQLFFLWISAKHTLDKLSL